MAAAKNSQPKAQSGTKKVTPSEGMQEAVVKSTYALASSSTIFEASEIHVALLAQMNGGPVAIDVAPVTEIDLSVAQILLAAQKSGCDVIGLQASDAASKLFERAGLTL